MPDALEQVRYARTGTEDLVYRSVCSSQCLSIGDADRLPESNIESSGGNVGDLYDNAKAEKIIGLYNTEVIRPRGTCRHIDAVEYAARECRHWFNNRRFRGSITNLPKAKPEQAYHDHMGSETEAAQLIEH